MAEANRWIGRVFVLRGRLMYVGPIAPTKQHAHHAFQVMLGRGCPLHLADHEGREVACSAATIGPNVSHAVAKVAPATVLMLVDPETRAGRQLKRLVMSSAEASSWVMAAAPLKDVPLEAPLDWRQAEKLSSHLLELLVGPATRPQPLHPAILKAMASIEATLPATASLRAIAAEAGLSPDRLSHIFSSQVGIPMRRYILWRRLMLVAQTAQQGESLTAAAHAAGFVDSAHMSHVFRRMFGLAPSDLHGFVEWVLPPRDQMWP